MEVQNAIPMDEWRLMQEQCFSILFSKYVFGKKVKLAHLI